MISVALQFLPESDQAPKIIASGEGLLGKKIFEIAKINKIPIVKDDQLAKMLVKEPIGTEIPENLYKAVAAIFSYIYKIENELKN